MASLRNAGPGTTLGASPLARWPTFVAGLGPLSVVVNTGRPSELVPATVVSPAPDQALWDRLFPPTTPVDAYKDDPPIVTRGPGGREPGPAPPAPGAGWRRRTPTGRRRRPWPTSTPRPCAPAPRSPSLREHQVAQAIAGGRGLVGSPAGDVRDAGERADRAPAPVGPLEASARAVQQAQVSDLLDPGSLTQARIEQAAAILRQQGHAAAATAAPLAPVLRRLRLSGAPPAPARTASRSNGTPSGATTAPDRTSAARGTGGTGSPPGGPPGTPPAPPA